jgi:hypothetical protein
MLTTVNPIKKLLMRFTFANPLREYFSLCVVLWIFSPVSGLGQGVEAGTIDSDAYGNSTGSSSSGRAAPNPYAARNQAIVNEFNQEQANIAAIQRAGENAINQVQQNYQRNNQATAVTPSASASPSVQSGEVR